MIKNIICVLVFTFFALGTYAQSNNANAFVTNLDRTVQLTDNQKTEITSMFNKLKTDIVQKSTEDKQALKVAFHKELRKTLTPKQVAALDSPIKGIR